MSKKTLKQKSNNGLVGQYKPKKFSFFKVFEKANTNNSHKSKLDKMIKKL